MGSSFDRPYTLDNTMVHDDVANVISMYVYNQGLTNFHFNLATAVGLFQSVVGVFFLLMANFISRKLGERGIW